MRLNELVYYLDNYLEIDQIADACVNGLEVECTQEITKIALAVDPAEQVFRKADQEGAQLVLLHHGLFWKEAVPITGPLYRRLRFLLRRDMAVYAAHLPLDVHEEVGHNAILAAMIGLSDQEPFVLHNGKTLGYIGLLPGIHRNDLADRLGTQLGVEPALWAFGRENVSRVAVCSGKADSELAEAYRRGCELYITGETSHTAFTMAQDMGINVLFLGHYGTETVGLKALGEHLQVKFGLETIFIDHPSGL